jgi:hypothetical protein
MAYGVTKERSCRIGPESVAGTPVAATVILRGPENSILDTRKVDHIDENVALSVLTSRLNTPKIGAGYTMPDTEVTFEQGPYILNASIRPLLTGVADGGTSTAKIYAFPFPTTVSDHTIKTYTLQAGNNNLVHQMEYSFVDKWGLSGSFDQPLKWTGVHWTGRQRTVSSFTSLSLTKPEICNFDNGKLYVNNSFATIGTTQYTNAWLAMALTCAPGLIAQPTGDGNLYFSFVKPTTVGLTGELTIEDDSQATGLESDWVANTLKYIRMKFTGTATGGAGGTYTTKLFQIDQCISIDIIDTLTSQNGNDTKKVHYTTVYDEANLFATMTFVNSLATLP